MRSVVTFFSISAFRIPHSEFLHLHLHLHPGGLRPPYPLQDTDRFCPTGYAIIPPMQTTPSTALDALALVFQSLNWKFDRLPNPERICSGFKLDKKNNAHLVLMSDDRGESLLLGCSFHFDVPRGSLPKLRRFIRKETAAFHGISSELDPTFGVRLTVRCWLPALDLPAESLRQIVEPPFRYLVRASTQLYPDLLKFLRHQERLRPSDDFHLPS